MDPNEIEDLGSGAMVIGELEQVDLSNLEQLIITLEASGNIEEVEV